MNHGFTTRILKLSDLKELESLYRTQLTHMGVPSDDYFQEHFDEALRSQYLNDAIDSRILMGTFYRDRLVLSMGIYFWKTLPSCTFLRFASRTDDLGGKEIVYAFRSLYSACLDELETRNYNRFYILTSEKHHASLAKIGGSWGRFRDQYFMTVEDVVPAGTRPQFDYVWSMMGSKEWPVNVIVRAGTLVNAYRKFDRSLVSPEALQIWERAGRGVSK
jgi:hypothetical protein